MAKKWTQEVRNDEHSYTLKGIYVPSDLVRYEPINKVIYEMRYRIHFFQPINWPHDAAITSFENPIKL
jgi:hypothetical protein